jgi:formate dehydrogenase maturation protein FdhE
MAFRDSPHFYRCRTCHWFKVITDLRDMKMKGHNYFEVCPVCGSAQTERLPCPSFVTEMARWLEKQRLHRKS